MKKSKTEIFLELAKPNENGISRWVSVSEFVGKYKTLALGNGGSWVVQVVLWQKKYIIEFDKSKNK